MAPKDIRSFFGGAPAAKATGVTQKRPSTGEPQQSEPKKAKKEEGLTQKSPAKPAAKAKAAAARAFPSSGAAAKSPGKAAAKASANTAAAGSSKRAAPAKKKASVKVKKRLDDSEDDFQSDGEEASDDGVIDLESDGDADSDEELPTKKRPAKGAQGGKAGKAEASGSSRRKAGPAIVVSDEEDAEVVRPPKPRASAPAATPARPAGRQIPSSLTPSSAAKPRVRAPKAPKPPPLTGAAAQAVAAVDAAVTKLPGPHAVKMTVMAVVEGGGFGGGGGEGDPPNHGCKEAPSGHPDALTGKTFVISGVLDSLRRHEADELIKRHGGRTTSAVSGKTTFLLCGENTGNSKLNAAKEKGTKIIDEDGLFALIEASAQFKPEETVAQAVAPSAGASASAPAFYGGASSSRASAPGAGTSASAQPVSGDAGTQLWVDKWKPQVAQDLVGNPTHLATMRQFLRDWHKVHNRGEKAGAAPGSSAKKDMTKKALLLAGPPGIGKTSSAHIIAKEMGFEVVEVNASDTRGKSDSKIKGGIDGKLANRLKELVTNTAISAGDGPGRRQVIVMDEVDGMSGGDRGGVADLIASIKISKLPIICICNDKYKQSLKSLRNHCLELEWRKPTNLQASARLTKICQAEGLQLNQATMNALVERAQGDLRMILGQLQMRRLGATSLSFDDVKASSRKDYDMSPFTCAQRLLASDSAFLSMGDRMELAFQDADLVPLLVQENYLNHRPSIAQNETQTMQLYAKAADAISAGDGVNKRVRMGQEWSLMPYSALMSCVYPAAYVRGQRVVFGTFPGEGNFPRFTAWMGNNSSTTKQKRICGELTTKMLAAGVVAARRDLRLHYLPLLRKALTTPLARDAAEGIPQVVELMQTYLISREDFDSILDITKFKTQASWGANPLENVSSQVKAAFTRAFNKEGLAVKTSIMVEQFKKGKGVKKPAVVDLGDNEDELGGEIAEAAAVNKIDEEEEEEVDTNALKTKGFDLLLKSSKASKGASKGASKAKKPAAPRGGAGRGAGRGAKGAGGRGKK